MHAPTMIEENGLSRYYGPFGAVEDVSFSIPRGQIVAFLGPNGAGKTTTMKMLTGYLAPSRGNARIAGRDVRADRIEASRRFGYLPATGPLYPDMTPAELLRFFGEVRAILFADRLLHHLFQTGQLGDPADSSTPIGNRYFSRFTKETPPIGG